MKDAIVDIWETGEFRTTDSIHHRYHIVGNEFWTQDHSHKDPLLSQLNYQQEEIGITIIHNAGLYSSFILNAI